MVCMAMAVLVGLAAFAFLLAAWNAARGRSLRVGVQEDM
jgi:hypothetical protein